MGGCHVLVLCNSVEWVTRICYLQYCLPYRGILLTRVFIIEQTIKHVSEAHLPKSLCPDGILRVKIPGWCAGAHLQHGRSGKSYGAETNLGIRIGQHGKGALLDDAESQQSNFYQQFPSKKGKGGTEGFRKGYFEDREHDILPVMTNSRHRAMSP